MAVYDRLSALDRIFLDVEGPNTHMHVAGVFLFEAGPLRHSEGGIDIDRLRAYVASRLPQIPRYRQRIARVPIENHPVWVDDERFNVEYHVRHTCLPHPGDDRQLERLCGRIISQQLDRGKPLWEMWIVEGLEHDRLALGIALFSYLGGLYWGFNADWECVPDLHDFVVAIDASFRELCEAADAAAAEAESG